MAHITFSPFFVNPASKSSPGTDARNHNCQLILGTLDVNDPQP